MNALTALAASIVRMSKDWSGSDPDVVRSPNEVGGDRRIAWQPGCSSVDFYSISKVGRYMRKVISPA